MSLSFIVDVVFFTVVCRYRLSIIICRFFTTLCRQRLSFISGFFHYRISFYRFYVVAVDHGIVLCGYRISFPFIVSFIVIALSFLLSIPFNVTVHRDVLSVVVIIIVHRCLCRADTERAKASPRRPADSEPW